MATTNGKSKKYAGITEPVKSTEQLEELIKEAPGLEEPVSSDSKSTTNNSSTAEELLKQAKAATKQQAQEEKQPDPTPTTGGEITTATSQIEGAIAQSAQELVKIEEQARAARVSMGFTEGQKDAQEIRQAYQLGLLSELTQAKAQDTNDLAEQLQALRSHTDATGATAINNLLIGLVKEPGKIAPLGQATPTQRKLKII